MTTKSIKIRNNLVLMVTIFFRKVDLCRLSRVFLVAKRKLAKSCGIRLLHCSKWILHSCQISLLPANHFYMTNFTARPRRSGLDINEANKNRWPEQGDQQIKVKIKNPVRTILSYIVSLRTLNSSSAFISARDTLVREIQSYAMAEFSSLPISFRLDDVFVLFTVKILLDILK